MFQVVIILLSIGFAWLLHRIADTRGGNAALWAVLGFCFGPLALPFVFLSGRGKGGMEQGYSDKA